MELVKDIINLSHYHGKLNNLAHHTDCNRWYGLANNGAEIKVTVNHDHGRVMFFSYDWRQLRTEVGNTALMSI